MSYFVLYIMAKKDKKVNAWQIIVAVVFPKVHKVHKVHTF